MDSEGSDGKLREVRWVLDTDELQAVVQSLPIALLTTNSEREIVGVNSAANKLFGYRDEELLGQKVELLIPERFAVKHPALYRSFVENPSSREMGAGRDLWALKKDGTEFPVEVALTVLDTSPPKYLASILDISYRKKTEELLKRQQQLLESNLQETQATLEQEISEKTITANDLMACFRQRSSNDTSGHLSFPDQVFYWCRIETGITV